MKHQNLQYNLLNLPSRITYQDGRMINYIYSATGTKLSVTYTNGGSIKNNQYCGNMLYENGTLKQILIDEGYITFNGSTPQYHFYLKDHLGNNRMVVNTSGIVEQVTHYYPFGGPFCERTTAGANTNATLQRYKYNGKELDRMGGLNWYDYGARHMDAARGVWPTMDPLAEKYYDVSPYAYCKDNPLRFVDLDGKDWKDKNDSNIKDLSNVNVYIFYSQDFKEQAMVQYDDAIKNGNIPALSLVDTEDDFANDWANMDGSIKDVMIMTHGKNQSIYLGEGEQLTSTGDGLTNLTKSPSLNVQDLKNPKGDIKNAVLHMYSCHSADDTAGPHEGQGALTGSMLPIAHAFAQQFHFKSVIGTKGSVNYHNWRNGTLWSSSNYLHPYPQNKKWVNYYRK